MKLNKFIKFSFVLVCLVLTSCSQEDDGIFLNNKDDSFVANYSEFEYQILDLVNNHRQNLGLNSLGIINEATKEAVSHTNYMVDQGVPSHDNFGERFNNLKSAVNAKHVAENVAYGYSTAEGVVNAWLNSKRHRSIIENAEFTDFGISTKSNDDGKNYFTHRFVKR